MPLAGVKFPRRRPGIATQEVVLVCNPLMSQNDPVGVRRHHRPN